MIKKSEIEQFYKDVEGLDLKFPVAGIAGAIKESKSTVSRILSKKLEPSESFLNRFYEKFPKSVKNVSRETEVSDPGSQYGYKDKYIQSLERENARLQKDLDLSLGELRHNILLSRAIGETNQQLLIEVLAKQRRKEFDFVALEVNKVNGENYKKMKEEGNFAYVGK